MLCEGCHGAISSWQLGIWSLSRVPDEGLQKFEGLGEGPFADAGGL
jgi:hypothetical protein